MNQQSATRHPDPNPLTIGQCATLACLLEVAIPKPGNVHRGADFEDVGFNDFVVSAVGIGPLMERAPQRRLGLTVWDAVKATEQLVGRNTNLGLILLLAPLAAAGGWLDSQAVGRILRSTTAEDCDDVYRAIRLARPGGLGTAPRYDISGPSPGDLLCAMRAAASGDTIARQYANAFKDVFSLVVPTITDALRRGWSLVDAVIGAHLRVMSDLPDSLIGRKCGRDFALRAGAMAQAVIGAGEPGDQAYDCALADLDFWLRCDGHRRNPGTTADMIGAGLFVALRNRLVRPPFSDRTSVSPIAVTRQLGASPWG